MLARMRRSSAFAGCGDQEGGHASLQRACCPRVRAPMFGLSGSLRTESTCPGAAPTALQVRWGLGSTRTNGDWGIPRPHLAVVSHAAAAPNPRHGLLVLGFPASLR